MRSRGPRPTRLAVALVLGLAACAASARADILILRSDVDTLARGRVMGDSEVLEVPAGRRVDILRPAGQTQSVRGPFKGAVGDLVRGEARNAAIWNRMLEDLSGEASSGRHREGATRGVSR